MKVVIQRVTNASVTCNERVAGAIGRGLCLLIGFSAEDNSAMLPEMVNKIVKLKLFDSVDGSKRWQGSLLDFPSLSVLAVSQFTLYAKTDKGTRPDFHNAKPGPEARALFDEMVQLMRDKLNTAGAERVATGAFGEYMQVEIVNDGPVTIVLDN